MWPSIIQNSKDGGADVVQSYVFWNGHEPEQGQVRVSFTFCLLDVVKSYTWLDFIKAVKYLYIENVAPNYLDVFSEIVDVICVQYLHICLAL